VTPFYDSSGRCTNLIGSVYDITERKEAEKKLARSNQKISEILESIQDAFYVIDKDWNIVYINKQLALRLGKKIEDLTGKNYWRTFPKYVGTIVEENFRLAMEKRETRRFETDGKYTGIYYGVTIYPSSDGITVLGTDITLRKKAEQSLALYSENLERLVEERTEQLKNSERLAAIGATAGMVGHDIRNPLQAITSDVYLAREELSSIPESEAKKNMVESLTEIERNIDYINKIVLDLQDYARPLTPTSRETKIENLCRDVLLKINIPKNIKTSFKAEEEIQVIMTDPDLLKRIIYNLVLNAVQAMPKGGKLSIYAHNNEGGLVIEVQDTGEGILDEVKNRLFTPMFTTKSKGQGFGLAVVKRVTEALNGTVSFETELGKGTKFIIRIPLTQTTKSL
jgi:PAS domain S-box-containing protein